MGKNETITEKSLEFLIEYSHMCVYTCVCVCIFWNKSQYMEEILYWSQRFVNLEIALKNAQTVERFTGNAIEE